MLVFSFFMIIVTIMIFLSSHPVFILSVILLQTLLICLNMWVMIKSSWFSFILFLIFLGGLMVLFVYIVSLASNEKFEINPTQIPPLLTLIYVIFLMTMILMFFNKMSNSNAESILLFNLNIFSKSFMLPTSLIMFYLLFTLIVAVKISSKFEGPVRNFLK